MEEITSRNIMVGIKGAGEMASGVAWRLWQANIRRIFMLEVPQSLAVRRKVSFCEAIYDGMIEVDGVPACLVESAAGIYRAWEKGCIAVSVDPGWKLIAEMAPQVVIDAIIAKRNLGTRINDAPLVIGLGPGFTSGEDVHMVIETNRGHNLGRVLVVGAAEANTGIPGEIGGYSTERVLRAPGPGIFRALKRIGDKVQKGEPVGDVEGREVAAGITGVIRGLLRDGTEVDRGAKLGDIDPRGDAGYCYTVSDKALAIGGATLEAILRVYNQ
ncbi:MAG: selenium-dependent molybdenum cofactor biosynthesis protein YqeB [Syntrophales bacterium]|nr:selenium-dependent molybdenum cofactor biosynthesis protein YqeB [Syntrophales bacterium]